MSRTRPFTIALALVLAAAMAFATGCKKRTPSGRGTGFTLQDLSGKSVSLSDFKGKVVLLEFWATWCPPCRASVPGLIRLNERFKDQDFALIAISLDDNEQAVRDFVSAHDIPYTVVMDDGHTSDNYGVFSIPTSLVIDRNGTVMSKHSGYAEDMIDDIARNIEEMLGAEPQPVAQPPLEPATEEHSSMQEQSASGQESASH